MLRVRKIQLWSYDHSSVDIDELTTELHECDLGRTSFLLMAMENELIVDYCRFDITRGDFSANFEQE